ncbi:hypothetical protein BABINDRAFT_162311 [Babjeviella inositovora NRRL Y-12698]|uniref:Cytochrome c oxidase subunit 13, mitochondrial n=1 Tax=Babjeviella inositovora NRRL Y-12698 TaxID=984486 RepID=A0A1E3QQC4_9ASCO|nr:uncharacterized protein BABINDRAFT_162311 [Babjeviella inositovora NRRL Y-12698]ODQ79282.1 hypothetical protein BABINDRAFT_162311 [Babjeviella inositovora NRRL Y-12698]
MLRQFTPRLSQTVGRRFQHAAANKPHRISDFVPNKEAAQKYLAEVKAAEDHAAGTADMWKKITYYIALPACFLVGVNTLFVELEHAKHREHMAHLSDEEWPQQYEYQNMRQKDYFWGDGDKTLFWNLIVNRHIRDN